MLGDRVGLGILRDGDEVDPPLDRRTQVALDVRDRADRAQELPPQPARFVDAEMDRVFLEVEVRSTWAYDDAVDGGLDPWCGVL